MHLVVQTSSSSSSKVFDKTDAGKTPQSTGEFFIPTQVVLYYMCPAFGLWGSSFRLKGLEEILTVDTLKDKEKLQYSA